MDAAALAFWTPVGLSLDGPEPTVDWCDLGAVAFTDPFFSQTLARIGTGQAPQVVRTTLSGLAQVEAAAGGRDPDGFVFHLARCGSTLVSRLAAQVPGIAVLSEPEPLNTLLEVPAERVNEAVLIDCVRLLLRAYGRGRPGAAHILVKLSSWNIRRIAVLRRAFPDTPWSFIYRAPEEVVASLLAGPPGWMALRQVPDRAASLLGLDAAGVPSLDAAGFAVEAVAGFMRAALEADDDAAALLIDYPSLPEALWTRILPAFGIACDDGTVARLGDAARWNAKHPDRPFVADGDTKRRTLPPAVIERIATALHPLYRDLEARRVARATPPPPLKPAP